MFDQRLHHSTFYFSSGVLCILGAIALGLGAFWSFQAEKIAAGMFGVIVSPAALLIGIRSFHRFRMAREEEKLWDPKLR